MFPQLLQYHDIGLFVLRAVVGVIFMYHALPKIKSPEGMAAGMGWPKGAIVLLGSIELLSAIALIIGLYVQLAALLLSLVMLGAIKTKMFKWHTPFFAHQATGWEFDLALLAANILFLLTGGGSIGF
jgi:putative oxidoreductase